MHFLRILNLVTVTAACGAFAFKVRAFTRLDCTGFSTDVNIWDETCRDYDLVITKSFRVLEYGGSGQRATFWKTNNCSYSLNDGDSPGDISASWLADGRDSEFGKTLCITLDHEAQAFESHAGTTKRNRDKNAVWLGD